MRLKHFTPYPIYFLSIYFQISAFVFFHVFNTLNTQGFLTAFVVVLITLFSTFFTYMGISMSIEGEKITFQAIRNEVLGK